MSVETILAIIGFGVTAAGLIGISFRVGRSAQTVSNYRDAADAWEKKANAQAVEISELKQRLNDAQTTIHTMQARLKLLEDLVTGRTAIIDLSERIETRFNALQTRMEGLAETIINNTRKGSAS